MSGKILAFGADGLVGSRFTDLYHQETQFITPKITELDITSKKSVDRFFKENSEEFASVINFAAITNVDAAEKERGNKKALTWQVNVRGVENVAEASKKFDKYFIQISTDFVFPGSKEDPGPYGEDKKLPQNQEGIGWYGWTKKEAEERAQTTWEKTAIVRITYPFRAHYPQKTDMARNILMLHDGGKLYPMFSDQKITPAFCDEIAKVLYLLVEEKPAGIFHVASMDVTTPYEFASYLLEKARGAKGVVKEGSIVEFLKKEGATPRPVYGGLLTDKTQKRLGVKLLSWREAVDELVKQLNG